MVGFSENGVGDLWISTSSKAADVKNGNYSNFTIFRSRGVVFLEICFVNKITNFKPAYFMIDNHSRKVS